MKRLSGPDAWFLYTESPTWPMHVGGLIIIEPPDESWSFDRAHELMVERISLVPELSMRVKEVPFQLDRPLLVEDPNFNIDAHIHRVGVPAPGGQRELAALVCELSQDPLDRRRPLWETWFIDGLADGNKAVFTKIHHALIDGGSGAGLTELLCDITPEPAPVAPAPTDSPPEAVPGDVELLGRALVRRAVSPVRTARWAFNFASRQVRNVRTAQNLGGRTALNRAPDVPFNGTIGTLRSAAYTSLALDRFKAVKDAHGVKLNDVVLAVIGGALRRWLEARDALPDDSVVASVPMSLRSEGDTEMGTQLANLYCALETQIADPLERLKAIASNMAAAKEIGNALKVQEIQRLSDIISPALANLAWQVFHRANLESLNVTPSNLVVSNIPGAPIPIYTAGAKIISMMPITGVVFRQGLNITMLSYMDSMDIGLVADRDMIPDAWELAELLDEALTELEEAAPPSKAGRSRSAKKSTTKKSTTKRSTAKKSTTKKSAARTPASSDS